jgi:TetR/AcrR family transcriptional repressor of multidrug resistance operon
VTTTIDRPAAIRRALRDLVAERGFHGASMSAVAKAAGVATGTAYVHYESKEDLVFATYLEIKRDLGEDLVAHTDSTAAPRERYGQMWLAIYRHLEREPERARFLAQLEESPFYETAHQKVIEQGDRLMEEAARPDLAGLLVDLPPGVTALLSMGIAVRLVAAGVNLNEGELETVIEATWRAISVPQ